MNVTIIAECRQCATTYFHVRGESGHVCEACGGRLVCDYVDCVIDDDRRIAARNVTARQTLA